jgi:hypothetical protein
MTVRNASIVGALCALSLIAGVVLGAWLSGPRVTQSEPAYKPAKQLKPILLLLSPSSDHGRSSTGRPQVG